MCQLIRMDFALRQSSSSGFNSAGDDTILAPNSHVRPIWFDVFIYIPFLVTAGTQSALGEIMFSLTHIRLHIAAVQRSRPNTCYMWINIYHSVLITSLVSCAVDPAVDIKPDILTMKVHWHDPYALSCFPLLQVETKSDSWAAMQKSCWYSLVAGSWAA